MARVPEVSLEELRLSLQAHEPLVLVDALADTAFREGHLPGAVSLPRARVAELAPERLPDKTARIIVYCKRRT